MNKKVRLRFLVQYRTFSGEPSPITEQKADRFHSKQAIANRV